MYKIVVVDTDYVDFVIRVCFVEVGQQVINVDIDEERKSNETRNLL